MTQSQLHELSEDFILVVEVDDILTGLERNSSGESVKRSHQLRFDRPLEGRVKGNLHENMRGSLWPNISNASLNIPPVDFLDDDAPYDTVYPLESTVGQAAMEIEGVDHIVEVSQRTLEECWESYLEIWENAVRDNLQDKVTINRRSQKTEPQEIPVEYGE